MPPEREDLQRQLEAFRKSLASLDAEQRGEPSADQPPPAPPTRPSRVAWARERGRVLLGLALVAAVLLAATLIGRALRSGSGASACPTGGGTPTAVVVGDSISTVTAPAGPNIAFPLVAGRLLGWHVNVDAHPDTGFTTPPGRGAQHPSFAATVGCAIAAHPRIVVVALGSDDAERADPARRVQSKATEGLAELRRRLPQAQVVAVGPLPTGGTPSQTLQAVRDAVRAAAQAANVAFIDPIAEGWITGERTDPGSGNADRMLSADGRHLTPAGHAYVGLRLATDLSRLGLASR